AGDAVKILGTVSCTLLLTGALWGQRGPLELVTLTPPSGRGNSQLFGLTVSDGNGGNDVASVGLYVTERFAAAQPANSCLAYYDRTANKIYLADDSGNNWKSTGLGSNSDLRN